MEEPFRKRPRLSLFSHQPVNQTLDQDLDTRRFRNDSILKSRFESIFEKYGRDFDGLGDEIDLTTGEVVVNNGHLDSMEDEKDIGLDSAQGRTLLRALTKVEETDDIYTNEAADQVMMSIEEIAENFPSDDDHKYTPPVDGDSDDQLFGPLQSRQTVMLPTPPKSQESQPTNLPVIQPNACKSESDSDSLFDVQHLPRSASPDSLFEVPLFQTTSPVLRTDTLPIFSAQTDRSADEIDIDEDTAQAEILARYGPQIGKEIIDMLQATRNKAEAHIEPAWRIPSNIRPPRISPVSSSPHKTSSPWPVGSILSEIPKLPDDESNATSLWALPKTRRTKKKPFRQSLPRQVRAESEDPLQDGFISEEDLRHQQGYSGSEDSSYEEVDFKKVDLEDEDEQLSSIRRGICPYCLGKWKSRNGVVNHWRKVISKADSDGDDDVHDMEYLRDFRDRTKARVRRRPRLTVSDFRTMVELHEGAGLSFEEIIGVKVLRTHKVGSALYDVYDRYRSSDEQEDHISHDWTEQELQSLHELCEVPTRDMGVLVRQLKLPDAVIGAKLSDIWLSAMGETVQILKARRVSSADVDGGRKHRESTADPLFIKAEESEDELFRLSII